TSSADDPVIEERSRAADAYATAEAQRGLDDDDAGYARSRLDELERDLGVIAVTAGPGAVGFIDAGVHRPPPARFHVAPRPHYAPVRRSDGSFVERPVLVAARATVDVSVPDAPKREPAALHDSHGPDARLVLGWIGVGAAVATAGAAIALGVEGLNAKSAYDDSGHSDADARSRAADFRTAADISWAGAAVLGVGGAILLVASRSRHSGVSGAVRSPVAYTLSF